MIRLKYKFVNFFNKNLKSNYESYFRLYLYKLNKLIYKIFILKILYVNIYTDRFLCIILKVLKL